VCLPFALASLSFETSVACLHFSIVSRERFFPTPYVFPTLTHAHAFRHGCGRRWAKIGTINELAAMLGHRSIQATMMYTTLSCDPELSKKFLA
jgi:integrase